ncbi:hypothetical protein, partial [Pseudoflavonifractor phocaeensis]|uniref:hypothetical protein n=1 Tax=Pseudoflavonifractor phocaeensis TaxID=1870988 RepID=UPI00195D54CC
QIKKEPGETNFLGLFCESLFRDNVLVCGGMSTKFVIVPLQPGRLSNHFDRQTPTLSFSKKVPN